MDKNSEEKSEHERKTLRDSTSFVDKILGEPSAVLLFRKHVGKNMLAGLFLVEITLLRSMFLRRKNNF